MATTKTAELSDDIKTARTALSELVEKNDAIADAARKDDEAGDGTVRITIEEGMREEFKSNLAQIKELQTTIELAEQQLAGKQFLDTPVPGQSVGGLSVAQASYGQPRKSIGQQFVESDEFKSMDHGRNGYTMGTPWNSKIADIARFAMQKAAGDIHTDTPTGTPGLFGTVQRVDMVGRPHRTFRVRDLITSVQTTARVIEYFRVTGFTNAASVVGERTGSTFVNKPQSTLAFVGEQAVVRTIAHWVAVHRDTLSDEPQLQNVIDTELLYGLQLIEDAQILTGTGTGQDMQGIIPTPGVQTQARATNTNTDAIRKAITKIMLAEYEATGIVIHPSNWETIELERETATGQYINAIVSNVAQGAEPRLWRLPIVVTQAIASGTGLVGAFGLGNTLYDREDASIRIAEQHADFFIQNAVVVLAEQREAQTVQRPESFCTVTGMN